ncbi:hypothetical protein ASE74_01885 [Pedobacter sp. Leaf216]|uniref:helix-turn-helix domain-containing protein n=1 Tax=Pedobacter sp. Leaf216 TaxID=1735684 RepID=UPI0006F76816|nr:helix-turn-helix transcriptional regulator [Pedobacter sp. Leaf216]KQM74760.1 hypothetical protein ASE74_01885 [Pedobacter sp. Leaf216]
MKNIREKLGLTQDQMSGLLGINRSSAAMYENGSRSIATKNLLLLSEIEIFLNNNVPEIIHSEINTKTDHAKSAIITKLNKQIDRAAYASLKLKRKLQLLQDTNLKTKNLWSVLVHLKLKMPENLPLLAYLEIWK